MSKKSKNQQRDNLQKILRYSGLSFQLFAVIAIGTWFGWYLDQQSTITFPVWLLVFVLLSTVVAFYHLYVSVKNDEGEDNP
ncbi:AtpZ/AtpI family protein [Mongoliitalea daihaiensis]|uniref:AtpZ/AtpI family protein n=1 Tax=Mongoliitalea daihaiensis TaxID=2782006 RepID=UPI001F29E690|nr:AtpZ/AtpI family protein [Mongoliitalea daihaiensis]UJP66286.1 AtpZ/AtpI family protein [Mongoliitalea daihaiensis]